MHDVLCLILGGGQGTRLYPLTKMRSEPAVPLACKYRLIDVPVSNCLNSGVTRVYVLTQFLSASLHRHLAKTYKVDQFSRGFVEALAAQQTNETADWYQGTADAIRQNIRYVQQEKCRDVLVLSGDQLFRMDFRPIVRWHREREADVTFPVSPVGRESATRLGVVRAGDDDRVQALVEKPQTEGQFNQLRTPTAWRTMRGAPPDGREFLANTGMYLFRREVLFDLLAAQPTATDLVREIFPRALTTHRLLAYLFTGYWEDVGTIKSYFETHLALAGPKPPFDFHDPDGVIYTRMRNLPAARMRSAKVSDCLIGDGCDVGAGSVLERCVVGIRTHIGAKATVRDAILLGADYVETTPQREENRRQGVPDLGVGDGSVLERCIVDKGCRIGRDVRVSNRRKVQHEDGPRHFIREGIVVIPENTVLPDGTEI